MISFSDSDSLVEKNAIINEKEHAKKEIHKIVDGMSEEDIFFLMEILKRTLRTK